MKSLASGWPLFDIAVCDEQPCAMLRNIERYSSFVVWSTVKQELQPMLPLVTGD